MGDLERRNVSGTVPLDREAQFRLLLESTGQGFAIIEILENPPGGKSDYRFLETNRLFESQSGLVDCIGKTMRELRPSSEETCFERYAEVVRTGKSTRAESNGESPSQYLETFAFRLGPSEQRQVGIIIRDITARRLAENALSSSQTQLHSLFMGAPLGIYVVDQDFRIAEVNPLAREAFGNMPDLIGGRFEEVIQKLWPAAYAQEIVSRFRHTLETGEDCFIPERIEQRLDTGACEIYEWLLCRIPLSGHHFGVVCYFRDISVHVRATQALSEAYRKKDEFIAMLSHELRNPLFAISNGVRLLWPIALQDREARGTIEMLERQVDQMVRRIDDLLDVSRLSRGKFELRKTPMELITVVQGVIESVQPTAEHFEHRLIVTVPPEAINMVADPTRVAQILENLLSNAFTFTPRSGRIELIIEQRGNEAILRVRDNGIGIAAEHLGGIFDMFSQVDTSLERLQEGMGLGLSLVKSLAELHGGSVEATSKGLDQGAEFIVRLPALSDASAMPSITPPVVSPDAPLHLRILMADDNQDALSSVAMLLKLSGHEVHTAVDGMEAVEAAEQLHPDAIILDIGMPRLNGYEAARRIRQQKWSEHALLIALTGFGQEQDRRRSAEAGFDAHLVKPADFLTLAKALSAARPAKAAGSVRREA